MMKAPLVVVDAANLATVVRGTMKVQRLQCALDYFEQLGVRCIAFAPGYWIKPRNLTPRSRQQANETLIQKSELAMIQQLVQQDKVILTPPQAHDDLFIIDYAIKHDGYVVTNDMFRDHVASKMEFHGKELTEAWVKTKCITFTFVGLEFLPSSSHMQTLLKSKSKPTISVSQTKPCLSKSPKTNKTASPKCLKPEIQINSPHLTINTKLQVKEPESVDDEVLFEKEVISSLKVSKGNQPKLATQLRMHIDSPSTKKSRDNRTPRSHHLAQNKTSTPKSSQKKIQEPEEGNFSHENEKINQSFSYEKKDISEEWSALKQMISKHHVDGTCQENNTELDDEYQQSIDQISPSGKQRNRRRGGQKKLMYRVRSLTSNDDTVD